MGLRNRACTQDHFFNFLLNDGGETAGCLLFPCDLCLPLLHPSYDFTLDIEWGKRDLKLP
jgi:hypothetical protein